MMWRIDKMEQVPTSILSAERCHLGEGPTYDAATDTAWWFDILEGRLFEAHLGNGQIRSHLLGRMASALGRIDAKRQLIAAEDGLYIRSVANGSMTLFRPLESDNTPPQEWRIFGKITQTRFDSKNYTYNPRIQPS